MSKRLMTVLLVIVFLLGLCILLYPTVANYVNSRSQTHAIEVYNEQAQAESEAYYQAMIDAAQSFNTELASGTTPSVLSQEKTEEYMSLLNPSNDGMMGYIQIPKIDVQLAIGHTVEENVLLTKVGHLPGTSLPVEGENVHAVLSAHRGLPSATLFTDLDMLEVGDTFTIQVLNRTYNYVIDDKTVILPEETEVLAVVPGKNYVTLMTCTPYGVNTHRLLVRGELVTEGADAPQLTTESNVKWYVRYREYIIIGAAALGVLFLVLVIRRARKR